MSAVVDSSQIQFYEEKKAVITNILDTAVKKLDFTQDAYVRAKAELMQVIEAPGNERVGLDKVVMLANQMIAKVANHSGYVIVEKAQSDPEVEALVTEVVAPTPESIAGEVSDAEGEPARPGQRQAKVALQQKQRESKAPDPSTVGKERLLTLMTFLPPLISRKEIELLSARVRMAKLGPPTGASPARSTGDLEREMVNQVRDEYGRTLSDLIKTHPKAFKEKVTMASGRTRVEDISDKLRNQLTRVNSLAAFLSIKDLVDRQIRAFEADQKGSKTNSHGLFFWRKK